MEVRNSEDNDEEVLVIVIKLELEHDEQGNIIETVQSMEQLSTEEENLQKQQCQMMVLNCQGSKSCSYNPPFDTEEPVWKKRKLRDSEESLALDGDDFPAISGVSLEPSGELKPMNMSAKSCIAMAFVDDQSTIKIKDYSDEDSSCIEKNDSNENVDVKNKCSKCLKYFTNEKSYWLHIDDEHPEVRNPQPLICNICETIFTTKPRLTRHMEELHNKLDTPSKQIRRSSLPNKLRKTHNSSSCPQTFSLESTENELKKHLRTHKGKKLHSCDNCTKRFSQKGHLENHLRIHTGEKPFPCYECAKSFTQLGQLKKHFKTHTGEKPHSCNQCFKFFSENEHLKNHMRTHTGEKPYQCTECPKWFSLKHTMKKHLKIHTADKNIKPYSCNNSSHKKMF